MLKKIARKILDDKPETDEARALYLDLMAKVITNTIYGDANQSPWAQPTYDAALRDTGRDWPVVAHSMIGMQRMNNLRQLCERTIQEGIPGDFIETGIWRGGACIMMRAVLKAYGDVSRKVYCADSFSGLPKPDPDRYPLDAGDRHHEFEQLAISLGEVKNNFKLYGLLDDQVAFVEGFFKDTLPKLAAQRFSVIRLDGDMYSSTKQALDALYEKLSPGGFIIVDDYGAIPACRSAVEDYRCDHHIDCPIEPIDWTGVWWQKRRI
jgi:macrocin-O-methyltransferase TylF-like protien